MGSELRKNFRRSARWPPVPSSREALVTTWPAALPFADQLQSRKIQRPRKAARIAGIFRSPPANAMIGRFAKLGRGRLVTRSAHHSLIAPGCRPGTSTAQPVCAVVPGAFGRDRARKSCRGFYQSSPTATAKRQRLKQCNCAGRTDSLPKQSKHQRLELFGVDFNFLPTMDAWPMKLALVHSTKISSW